MPLKRAVSEYSLNLLGELRTETELSRNYHRDVVANLDQANPQQRDDLLVAYGSGRENERFAQRSRENTKRKEDMAKANGQIAALRKDIKGIEDGDSVLFWQDKWKEECGFWFSWWRYYRATYPHTVPYDSVTKMLENGTYIYQTVKDASPDLDLWFCSKTGYNCEGSIGVFVRPKDHPETKETLASKRQEIADLEIQNTERTRLVNQFESESDTDLAGAIARLTREFEENLRTLNGAIELKRNVDGLAEEMDLEIESSRRLATYLVELNSKRHMLTRFLDACTQCQEHEEIDDITEAAYDMTFAAYILDPVKVRCPGGDHPAIHQRRALAGWLRQRNGMCPSCGTDSARIGTLGALPSQISDVFEHLNMHVLSRAEALEKIQQELEKQRAGVADAQAGPRVEAAN